VVVIDDFPEIRGPDDTAGPGRSRSRYCKRSYFISIDEAAAAANILKTFLEVFERALPLGRALSPLQGSRQ